MYQVITQTHGNFTVRDVLTLVKLEQILTKSKIAYVVSFINQLTLF